MRGRGRRLAALAGLATLALAACQAPGAGPQPAPSASAAGNDQLARADQRFWSGDYDGAESLYQELAKSRVAGAASRYAVFLAYQSRFAEAVTQAQAGVRQKADSGALARLTRALDWSDDVDAAVAAGGRAVATQPVDPLAHAYYSEALADAGRFDDARQQLRAAENAHPSDRYTQAEIFREWANFYRDQGDAEGELNYTELALKTQPKFPERTLELARYYYVHQKPDEAHAQINAAGRLSESYGVHLAAGDSAFYSGDLDVADAQYQAALGVRPAAAGASLGAAEVRVAGSRDFRAAHDQLLQALRKDPSNSDVFEFLWYLDKLVLKTDPAAELAPIAATPPGGLATDRQAALDVVNGYRQQAGVPPVTADPALSEGAEEHAWYTIFNYGQPSQSGLGIHTEDPSLPGFTGANFLQRDIAAGYRGNRGSEVIDHVYTPSAAVSVWIDSVYHRFPILDRETQAAGYGEASIGILAAAVMDLGVGAPAKTAPVVFPATGAREVPAAFVGHEDPDPAPAGTQYPVGYPVTLTVGSGSAFHVDSSKLLGPDGKELAGFTLMPGQQVDSWAWCFLPQDPLRPGATYTAELTGTLDGQPLDQRWSFTVTGSQ
ncbi:MAG TPA: CAP domain-containing protein [Candidatus Dormibacteraeota bacterium]